MEQSWWRGTGGGVLRALACAAAILGLAGCNNDEGGGTAGSDDFGDNDPNLYVAIGDCTTEVGYPAVLAGMLGKPVVNLGKGASGAGYWAERTPGVLSERKPGYLLMVIGLDDVVHYRDVDTSIEAVRSAVRAAKANKTVPVLGTLLPLLGEHAAFYDAGRAFSARIRQLAGDEGVTLADLEAAFGDDPSLLQANGEHPNAAGNVVMAETFMGVL